MSTNPGWKGAVVEGSVATCLPCVFRASARNSVQERPLVLAGRGSVFVNGQVFVMNFSVFLERIPVAMGRTKTVFYAGLVGSWIGQVPGVILVLQLWREDLFGLYWGVTFGYLLLCCVLVWIISRIRWEEVVAEAKARAHAK
jgi:Na+-driven multidrug efflux pump